MLCCTTLQHFGVSVMLELDIWKQGSGVWEQISFVAKCWSHSSLIRSVV